MINDNYKLEKFTHPFPYIKIKNFLNLEFFKALELNFPKVEEFKSSIRSVKRMDYDTSYGDNLYNDLIVKNEYFKKFHEYVYSPEFANFFITIFKEDIENEYKKGFLIDDVSNYDISPEPFEVGGVIGKKLFKKKNNKFFYPRLDVGMGLIGYGKNNGGGGIHIDNPQRLISILFYLGGYEKIEGGEHRIWKKSINENNLELHDSVKPEKNLLIGGLQNNLAFHDVNPVTLIEGSRNAFYLAISSSIPIWKVVGHSKFNSTYNKNRVKLSFYQKLKKFIIN